MTSKNSFKNSNCRSTSASCSFARETSFFGLNHDFQQPLDKIRRMCIENRSWWRSKVHKPVEKVTLGIAVADGRLSFFTSC